jgi:hypothetical protein
MKRLLVAALVGLVIVATLSISASAFKCLARNSNGVSTWGYGLIFHGQLNLQCAIVALQVASIVISSSVGKNSSLLRGRMLHPAGRRPRRCFHLLVQSPRIATLVGLRQMALSGPFCVGWVPAFFAPLCAVRIAAGFFGVGRLRLDAFA